MEGASQRERRRCLKCASGAAANACVMPWGTCPGRQAWKYQESFRRRGAPVTGMPRDAAESPDRKPDVTHDQSRRISASAELPAHLAAKSSTAGSPRSRLGSGRRRRPAVLEVAPQLAILPGRARHAQNRRALSLRRRGHAYAHAQTTARAALAAPPARDRLRIAGRRSVPI
jgi:hypothetical protein